MTEEPDYILQIRVKNGHMLRAMRRAGFKSGSELCRATGLWPNTVNDLLAMRISPLKSKTNDWSEAAWRIATALHMDPDELWPEHMARIKTRVGMVEMDANMETMAQIVDIDRDTSWSAKMLGPAVEAALSQLPPRTRAVLECRFGLNGPEKTLEEIGKEWGIARETVRIIEAKALRQLKLPARKSKIRDKLGSVPAP